MSKGTIFVGWGALIPGREKVAAQVLNESVEYLIHLQQTGEIDSFELVALEPHGGDLAGFVLVKGDKDKISQIRVSTELERIVVRMQLVHQGVGVTTAYTGAEMQSLFQVWDAQEEELLG